MNDKIRELADEAGINYVTGMGYSHDKVSDLQLKDFAGLIQYEIIKVIEGCHYRNGIDSEHNKALNMVVEQIKKHFGVE